MRYIKLYESYSNIEHFLSKIESKFEYNINNKGEIDIDGDISLINIGLNINNIPFKFGTIRGSFNCSGIGLKSLFNSPRIIDGDFLVNYNRLENLENGPSVVNGSYSVDNNYQLNSMFGIASNIGKGLYLSNNTSLYEIDYITKNNLFLIRLENTPVYSLRNLENCKIVQGNDKLKYLNYILIDKYNYEVFNSANIIYKKGNNIMFNYKLFKSLMEDLNLENKADINILTSLGYTIIR